MTEPTGTSASPQAAPQQMIINAQYIKDFSFESPNAPSIFVQHPNPPQFEVTVNVMTRPMDANLHEVVLVLKMESRFEERVGFIAELSYAGLFTLPDMPKDQVQAMLTVEGPRYLYPFARAIVTDAVQNSGFAPPPLMPIDFAEMYRQRLAASGNAVPMVAAGNA